MTYLELYEKSLNDLEHNKITLGEFDERVKPLNQEVRKTGHWIKEGLLFTCANCGHKYMSVGRENGDNYCSHCGCKMEEDKE